MFLCLYNFIFIIYYYSENMHLFKSGLTRQFTIQAVLYNKNGILNSVFLQIYIFV